MTCCRLSLLRAVHAKHVSFCAPRGNARGGQGEAGGACTRDGGRLTTLCLKPFMAATGARARQQRRRVAERGSGGLLSGRPQRRRDQQRQWMSAHAQHTGSRGQRQAQVDIEAGRVRRRRAVVVGLGGMRGSWRGGRARRDGERQLVRRWLQERRATLPARERCVLIGAASMRMQQHVQVASPAHSRTAA